MGPLSIIGCFAELLKRQGCSNEEVWTCHWCHMKGNIMEIPKWLWKLKSNFIKWVPWATQGYKEKLLKHQGCSNEELWTFYWWQMKENGVKIYK